jgi:hypothetical protein
MNNHGFFATYTGMLSVAARRDAAPAAPRARRAKRGFAARLLRLA